MPKQNSQQIAAAVQNPMQQLVDKYSIPRRVLTVDRLPSGAMPIYDSNGSVILINESVQTAVRHGARVEIPTVEITTNFSVNIAAFQLMTLEDIGRRITVTVENDLITREDDLFFELLKASESTCQRDSSIIRDLNEFNEVIFSAAINIEKYDIRPQFLICNEKQQKFFSHLMINHGLEMIPSKLCDSNTFYILPSKETFGTVLIRQDLTCVPTDNPIEASLGWAFFEIIGMALFNPKYLVKHEFVYRGQDKFKSKYDYFEKSWKEEDEVTVA